MQMSKEIKSLPWLTFEHKNELYQFKVTGKWHIENRERLLILDFAPNSKYPHWRSQANAFRMVISKKQRDFAILPKDKDRTVRKNLYDA